MNLTKCCVFLLSLWLCAGAQEIQTGAGHRFVAADYSGGKLFVVSPEGKVEWQWDEAPGCDDVWMLENGNVLFVAGRAVREVTREKKVVFQYESGSEIFACQRLEDGNTFIGECSGGRLLEVDRAGKVVHEVRLVPEGTDAGHVFMRNARRLENGHYLVAHSGTEMVREYDREGKVLMEIPASGGPHSAIRLPNGNTLISVGDMHKTARVFEVDKSGKTVWSVGTEELEGITLKFIAGVHRLANGNTVLSNWLGHGEFGNGPHIVEVTRDKQVVWTFQDHATMKTVASVHVLDGGEAGQPLR